MVRLKIDITCVCLNPAIDKIVFIERFRSGELFRVGNKQVIRSPGGKAINVAKVLKQLNYGALATGFIAGGSGMWIKDRIEAMGVETDFITLDGETRTNLNIIDSVDNKETEILELGPAANEKKLLELIDKITELAQKSKVMVFSGGLPEGVPKNIYAKLIKIAKNYGVKTILDAGGEMLEEGLKAGPTLIKPNLRELSGLVGKPLLERQEVIDASKYLLKSYGLEYVMASIGARGAILCKYKDSKLKCLHAAPPKVEVINTIGSGDAMVAGISVGFANNRDDERILKMGIACAASNTQLMEVGSIDHKKTMEFVDKITVNEC